MSSAASYDTKERVKQAVDIVDLVQAYLPLRREGRGFKALCPWHDDTRPSLQVNPERQSFKCWVCDIGGDIFSFVMKMEGVDVSRGAGDAGRSGRHSIRSPPAGGGRGGGADDKRMLYQAMAWAEQRSITSSCLPAPRPSRPARISPARRITAESMRRFQLGFAPDRWEWLLEQRGRNASIARRCSKRVGLVSRRRNGPRLLRSLQGSGAVSDLRRPGPRRSALGGRVLPELATADAAKYVNSPETPLFSKSNLLYGLDVARDAIRKIQHGAGDGGLHRLHRGASVRLRQHRGRVGHGAAASHIQLLRRYADRPRVVLVLDGDEAGRRRAKEVLELFVSANVDLRVLTLPDELDPADYLLTHGAAAFEALVENAIDALSHAFHTATARSIRSTTCTRRPRPWSSSWPRLPKLRGCVPTREIEDRLREEKFLQRLAVGFSSERGASAAADDRAAPQDGVAQPTIQRQQSASVAAPLDPLERELLEILLQLPTAMDRVWGVIEADAMARWRGRHWCISAVATLWRRGNSAGLRPTVIGV